MVVTVGVNVSAASVAVCATSVRCDRQGQPQPPQCEEHAVGGQSGAGLGRIARNANLCVCRARKGILAASSTRPAASAARRQAAAAAGPAASSSRHLVVASGRRACRTGNASAQAAQ